MGRVGRCMGRVGASLGPCLERHPSFRISHDGPRAPAFTPAHARVSPGPMTNEPLPSGKTGAPVRLAVTRETIRAAHARIARHVRRTPVMRLPQGAFGHG